jgi:GNAT superfamily N-acetyltransferase
LSLYSQYILERTDRLILETEYGFATYVYLPDNTVYIEDIFVLPEYRKKGIASQFADEIVELARNKGCKKVIGSVVPSAKTSTDSMKTLLAYGMKIESSVNNFITLSKEI